MEHENQLLTLKIVLFWLQLKVIFIGIYFINSFFDQLTHSLVHKMSENRNNDHHKFPESKVTCLCLPKTQKCSIYTDIKQRKATKCPFLRCWNQRMFDVFALFKVSRSKIVFPGLLTTSHSLQLNILKRKQATWRCHHGHFSLFTDQTFNLKKIIKKWVNDENNH